MTKTKWIAVITVTVAFVALCAFGIIWLKNSNERLNKLLENADYQAKTEATQTEIITEPEEPEETTATERKTLTEKAKELEQNGETLPQETEPPNEKEEKITDKETEENPISEKQEEINPITDVIEIFGWQDYDDYGELLPQYELPEETTVQEILNETLLIPMEGEGNE